MKGARKNISLVVALALLSGSVQGQVQPPATVDMNKDVQERLKGASPLRIYGRDAYVAKAFEALNDGKPVVLVGAEKSGRQGVVEAGIIEQEFIIQNSSTPLQKEYIVHAFDIQEALRYLDEDLKQSNTQNDLSSKLNAHDSRSRMENAAPVMALRAAIDQVEALNKAASASTRPNVETSVHALKIHIDGMLLGFGGNAANDFFNQIKIAIIKKIPLYITMDEAVYKETFDKIPGAKDLIERIDVLPLEEDTQRKLVIDRVKEILSKQVSKEAKSVTFSALAIDEMVRIVQLKGNSAAVASIDKLINELIKEKLMAEESERLAIKKELAKIDHELSIANDKNAIKKLNLLRLEAELKLKSFKSGKIDSVDIPNQPAKASVAQAEKGLFEKIGAAIGDKAKSVFQSDDSRTEAVMIREPVKSTWDEVLPEDEDGKNNLIKKVNDFVERLQDIRNKDVSVTSIHRIALEKLGVSASQLNFNPKNIQANLATYLDKRIIGLTSLKRTIVGDITERLRKGPDPRKPNMPMIKFVAVGETGTGKSEVIRSLADGTGAETVRLNGNELIDAFAKTTFMKSPPAFAGGDIASPLEKIAKNPNKKYILWIDEIDKLPIETLQTLMEAMDAGEMVLNDGTKINFKNVMLGATANWAPEVFAVKFESPEWYELVRQARTPEKEIAGQPYEKAVKRVLIDYLVNVGHTRVDAHGHQMRQKYPRELLARLGDIYIVQRFSSYEARRVIVKTLLEVQESYQKHGLKITYSSDLVYQIRNSYDKSLNGRGIESDIKDVRRNIDDTVREFLATNKISDEQFNEKYTVVVDAEVERYAAYKVPHNYDENQLALPLERNGLPMDASEGVKYTAKRPTVHIVEKQVFEEIAGQVIKDASAARENPRTSVFYRNKQSGGLAPLSSLEKSSSVLGEQSTFLTEKMIKSLRGRIRVR